MDHLSVKLKISQAEIFSPGTWPFHALGTSGDVAMDAVNHKRVNKGRNFVRHWRKHRKLTQEKLAELTGYTASSISQLETGVQGYEEATLVRLAQALRCRPGDLISGPPEEIALLTELRELEPEHRAEVMQALHEMLTHLKRLAAK
jgi:transcriptional regulator with XRE-family HTH domain